MSNELDAKAQLKFALEEFLRTCDHNYWWPAGNEVQIPTNKERGLLDILLSDNFGDAEKGSVIKPLSTDVQTGYSIATFGIRIASLGVRNVSVELFRLGVLVFVAAGPDFDWRDSMTVISVLDFFAKCLDVDVFDQLSLAIETLNASRWNSVIQSYRLRSPMEQSEWAERLIRSSPVLRDFMPL